MKKQGHQQAASDGAPGQQLWWVDRHNFKARPLPWPIHFEDIGLLAGRQYRTNPP